MQHVIPGFAAAVLLFMGFPAEAGVLFDNGPAAATDDGAQNSDPYTVYDNFTLSTSAIIEGVTWGEHDATNSFNKTIFYNSTDITFFNAIPSAISEIISLNIVANRVANGSPDVFSKIGFNYSIAGLSLSLAAGTYYIGLHSKFDNGEQSTWDQSAGNSSSIAGRYLTSSPPDAGTFLPNDDSVFQILGTPVTDRDADPPSQAVPEPSTLIASSVLLGLFGIRRAARRLGQKKRHRG